MKKTIYYFSGTHWDREWYIPYQEFRMKLVGALDALVELLEHDPHFGVFHLDGQTVVLEDYREIRPENAARLQKQIAAGRVLIGPWYVMPDEFLTSGEALIRNFLTGSRLCREWGAAPWTVGYVPDIFGHIAQLPQILRGVGIQSAMLARGLPPDTPPFFRWRAPNGDEVTAYRFPPQEGYGSFCLQVTGRLTSFAECAPDDPAFAERAAAYIDREFARANAPFAVACDAMDHEPPHRYTSAYIDRLRALYPDCDIRHTDMRELFERLTPFADTLPVHTGELSSASKDGGMPTIFHTLSSRVSLKQRNSCAESLLEKLTEPALVCGRLRGVSPPPAYRRRAWEYLLQNHPHDSLCGCSLDQVHEDMLYRFAQTEEICEALLKHLRDSLFGRQVIPAEGGFIHLFDPAPTARRGMLTVTVPFKPDFPKYREPFGYEDINCFRLYTLSGQEIPYTITKLSKNRVFLRFGETWEKVDEYTLAFAADLLPAGLTAVRVSPCTAPVRFFGTPLFNGDAIENDLVRLSWHNDGTVDLYDKSAGRTYSRLLRLWEDGEIGDGWNSVRPKAGSAVTGGWLTGVTAAVNSPLLAVVTLHILYTVPAGLQRTDQGLSRSGETVSLPVDLTLTLWRESRMPEVRLALDNTADNHRLRLALPVGKDIGRYTVNQSFAFIERQMEPDPATASWVEADPAEKNMHGIIFARRADGSGLAFVGQHGFYEAGGGQGTLFVTLLRGFDRVYYRDRLTTGQERGRHEFTFTLVPLQPTDTPCRLQQLQDEEKTAVRSFCADRAHTDSLLSVQGDVCISALKPAEDDSADIILRLYNPADVSARADIATPYVLHSAALCDLAEQPTGSLTPHSGQIFATLAPWQIQTFRLTILCKNEE